MVASTLPTTLHCPKCWRCTRVCVAMCMQPQVALGRTPEGSSLWMAGVRSSTHSNQRTVPGVCLAACALSCLLASVNAAAVLNSMQKGIVNGQLFIAMNFRDWSGDFLYNLTLAASVSIP